jgi:transcriptional regulator with XRE-family HTH domain
MAGDAKTLSLRRILGINIRTRRAELEMSQEKLAHEIETWPSEMSAIELGRANATVDRIEKIAKALDIEPAKLLEPIRR